MSATPRASAPTRSIRWRCSDKEYIEKCHEAGLIVNPWTVNKDFFIESLCDWGCDGVITDIPDLAREIANEKFGE